MPVKACRGVGEGTLYERGETMGDVEGKFVVLSGYRCSWIYQRRKESACCTVWRKGESMG